MSSVGVDDLNKALQRELEEYTKNLSNKVNEDSITIVKELVNNIKDNAATLRLHRTGDYIKGWRYKKVGTSYIVHNSANYQLTHLLEKGHAKVDGGRVSGYAHIRPAELKAIRDFEEAIEKAAETS